MAITAQEGKKMMQELGDKLLILDVRHAHEYEWWRMRTMKMLSKC